MRTLNIIVVLFFSLLMVCGLAVAQEGAPGPQTPPAPEGQPGVETGNTIAPPPPGADAQNPPLVGTPDGERPVTQADLDGLASKDDLAAAMAQWQAANNAANTAQRQGRPNAHHLRQRANALALQLSALKARMEKLEQANIGGPASDWARESVQSALDSGLLVGRRDGATVDDDEWQSAADRQELAAGLLRVEARANANASAAAETAVKAHNEDRDAHPFLQDLIGAEVGQRKQADNWQWWAIGLALLLALLALVLALLQRRVHTPEPDEEPDEPDAPTPDGPDGPVPAPTPGDGPAPAPAPEPEPTPDEGGDDDQ